MFNLYNENEFLKEIQKIKAEAGSHSPSINTIRNSFPNLEIKIDACFLSNPYATDLFMKSFYKDIVDTGKLRDLLEFYPSQNKVIAKKLSKSFNLSSDHFFIGNGAIEPIQAVLHNFVDKNILINIPTFSPYYEFLDSGKNIFYNNIFSDSNFEISCDNINRLILENNIDTFVLINPNNPDGSYLNYESVKYLLDLTRNLDCVIIDESFIHFAYESEQFEQISFVDLVQIYPNLIVVKSMSKDFGVAGLRAGFAVMSKQRVSKLVSNGYLWNVNGITEYFFELYCNEQFIKEYEVVRIKYIKETILFFNELVSINGIKVYPTMGNFVLVELLGEMDSDEFVFRMLYRHGVYARTCSDKIGLNNKFIRIASRGKNENEKIISALKCMLNYEF
jgi:histidinol-phosphate/aromatic aminotransferase/cobyric acid decarboxylase-like protein